MQPKRKKNLSKMHSMENNQFDNLSIKNNLSTENQESGLHSIDLNKKNRSKKFSISKTIKNNLKNSNVYLSKHEMEYGSSNFIQSQEHLDDTKNDYKQYRVSTSKNAHSLTEI